LIIEFFAECDFAVDTANEMALESCGDKISNDSAQHAGLGGRARIRTLDRLIKIYKKTDTLPGVRLCPQKLATSQ